MYGIDDYSESVEKVSTHESKLFHKKSFDLTNECNLILSKAILCETKVLFWSDDLIAHKLKILISLSAKISYYSFHLYLEISRLPI
jgi:hypothetical protein